MNLQPITVMIHDGTSCSNGGFLIGYAHVECLKCGGYGRKPACWSKLDRPLTVTDSTQPFNAGAFYAAMKRSENDRISAKALCA